MATDDENPFDWDEATVTSEVDVSPEDLDSGTRPCLLDQVEGPGAPKKFKLSTQRIVIGRSAEAEIQVPSSEVSRQHTVLEKNGVEYSVKDLGSRNGIYLNGIKIHSAVLREGDSIQLGNVIFIFHERA